ncbi:hypothetical protein [Stenotrophomonas acidaminiphila]|uniref:hypothetical protein n=1 Tax=Stenotrophomonas acidaminiphila TaxID=128780 RepID=UPI001FB0235B|nr:hypothetical protein [Stenotrophomonas acidaminiphila]
MATISSQATAAPATSPAADQPSGGNSDAPLYEPVIIDLFREPERPLSPSGMQPRFEQIRERVRQFADYFVLARKRPDRIAVAPPDFEALIRSINARIRAEARQEAARINESRKAAGSKGPRVKPAFHLVDALTWQGIPLVRGQEYSKHRPVDLSPTPTTSSLSP